MPAAPLHTPVDDESFDLLHRNRGDLSMANCGPNTNGSQFFVTFVPTSYLNGVCGSALPLPRPHDDCNETDFPSPGSRSITLSSAVLWRVYVMFRAYTHP